VDRHREHGEAFVELLPNDPRDIVGVALRRDRVDRHPDLDLVPVAHREIHADRLVASTAQRLLSVNERADRTATGYERREQSGDANQ
jgi:hypothetical protein